MPTNRIAARLDATFSALSDPTRRAIIGRLAQGELSLGTLAEPLDMSQTAVTKHVRVLADAGLVVVEKRGRTKYCKLETSPMKDAFDWLAYYRVFWQDQFKSLGRHLDTDRRRKRS